MRLQQFRLIGAFARSHSVISPLPALFLNTLAAQSSKADDAIPIPIPSTLLTVIGSFEG